VIALENLDIIPETPFAPVRSSEKTRNFSLEISIIDWKLKTKTKSLSFFIPILSYEIWTNIRC
jgi:hypothetical protein